MCAFIMVSVQTTQLNSSYNLVTLTFNRYFAVTNPNLCNTLFSRKRSLATSLLIWTCAFILTCVLYISPEKGKVKVTTCLVSNTIKNIFRHIPRKSTWYIFQESSSSMTGNVSQLRIMRNRDELSRQMYCLPSDTLSLKYRSRSLFGGPPNVPCSPF